MDAIVEPKTGSIYDALIVDGTVNVALQQLKLGWHVESILKVIEGLESDSLELDKISARMLQNDLSQLLEIVETHQGIAETLRDHKDRRLGLLLPEVNPNEVFEDSARSKIFAAVECISRTRPGILDLRSLEVGLNGLLRVEASNRSSSGDDQKIALSRINAQAWPGNATSSSISSSAEFGYLVLKVLSNSRLGLEGARLYLTDGV